jgi:hypothetical protein
MKFVQVPEDFYEYHKQLVDQNIAMKDAMHEFCMRVDLGEVRSKYTYAKFKTILTMPGVKHEPT